LGDVNAMANPVYTENDAAGAVTAQVRFCVRFSLGTTFNDGTSNVTEEVNFLETVVTLNVDLSDGFEVTAIDVAPRDRLVRTAAQAYTCEGYFCDANEVKLTETDLATARNQGAQLRICVIPAADARTDGVYMRRIDSFEWRREDTANGVAITQPAVVNALPATNGLTTLDCAAGDLICRFESVLFAQFYATAGTVAGAGVCSMQFGGNGCTILNDGDATSAVFGGVDPESCATPSRKLRSNRFLQNEEAATAEFDLNIDLVQGTAPIADGEASSASTVSMAMAVLAAGAALML
jgi:hypothetical protein